MGAMKAKRLDRHIRAQAAQTYPELERQAAARDRYAQKVVLFAALYGADPQKQRAAAAALQVGDAARRMAEAQAEVARLDAEADRLWHERQAALDKINASYFPTAYKVDVALEAADLRLEILKQAAEAGADPQAEAAERKLLDLLP